MKKLDRALDSESFQGIAFMLWFKTLSSFFNSANVCTDFVGLGIMLDAGIQRWAGLDLYLVVTSCLMKESAKAQSQWTIPAGIKVFIDCLEHMEKRVTKCQKNVAWIWADY